MALRPHQIKDFAELLQDEIPFSSFLPMAVDWVAANLRPEDVFPESELDSWAEDNGWTKEGAS